LKVLRESAVTDSGEEEKQEERKEEKAVIDTLSVKICNHLVEL